MPACKRAFSQIYCTVLCIHKPCKKKDQWVFCCSAELGCFLCLCSSSCEEILPLDMGTAHTWHPGAESSQSPICFISQRLWKVKMAGVAKRGYEICGAIAWWVCWLMIKHFRRCTISKSNNINPEVYRQRHSYPFLSLSLAKEKILIHLS